MGLVIAGVFLAIGLTIFNQFHENRGLQQQIAFSQNFTASSSATALTHGDISTTVTLYNQTREYTFPATNYTVTTTGTGTGRTSTIVLKGNNLLNATGAAMTYSYYAETNTTLASFDALSAASDIGGWFSVIVVVSIAIIIIMLIAGFGWFGSKRR